jgi:hypothetical protein
MRAGWLTASLSSTGQQPWPGTHGGSNNASVPDVADRQRTHRGHAEAGNRSAARPSGTRRPAQPACARSRQSAAALPRPDHPARIRLSGGQVVDNDDGIVLDHTLEQGNPADAPQLAPAIERVIARTGRRPRTVTADRGYGEKGIDEALHQMGVRTVVIPRMGRPGRDRRAAEHRPMFRRTVKCADRQRRPDQHPQRGYGWDRTAWIAPKEPGSGQGTGSWPTTWSRSGPWPANRPISQTTSNRATAAPLPVSARDLSGRSSQTLRTLHHAERHRSDLSARRSRISLTHRQAHKIGNCTTPQEEALGDRSLSVNVRALK